MKYALTVVALLAGMVEAQASNSYLEQLEADVEAGTLIDWRAVRQEIHERHLDPATSSDDRARYVAVWYAVMMSARPTIAEVDREKFNRALNQEYNFFIIQESVAGVDVDPDKLYQVTNREIQAGRMARNHHLRVLAIFSVRGLASLLDEHPGLYEDLAAGGDL